MRFSWLFFFLLTILVSQAQTYRVRIETNYGKIELLLYDGTPKHRDNFIRLAKTNFFDSLLFHRVIQGFVIQAGDPDSKSAADTALLGDGDLGYSIPAEIYPQQYFHKRGALGMARDDNPMKASSACQFYIVQGKTANDSTFFKAKQRTNGYVIPDSIKNIYRTNGGIPHLDSRYTVFGEVISGMQVVDSIAAISTDSNDRPKTPVYILHTAVVPRTSAYPYSEKDRLLQGIWQSNTDSNTYTVFKRGKVYHYYHMSDGENVFTASDYFFADNCIAETDKTLTGITYLLERYEKMIQCSEINLLTPKTFSYMDAVTGRIFTMSKINKLPHR
ncbi:MAG: peptidylprolyl isomerase [Bacteroidetes bacterium]|nr:peptidylprolyl isomerase [Bacteroidota bacterium]